MFIQPSPPVVCYVKTCAVVPVSTAGRLHVVGPTKHVPRYVKVHSVGGKTYTVPPIKHMDLPKPGWWTTIGIRDNGISYSYMFTPTKYCDDAFLGFFLSEDDKRPQLGKLFAKEPHDLTVDEKVECLDQAKANRVARTVMWNQRKILEIEEIGDFCMQPTHIYELILDSGASNSRPESFTPARVRFYAIGDAYERYIGSVKKALKTIEWQQ